MDIWNFVANKNDTVSVGGHIGGAIVGVTLGVYILENFYEQKFEKIISYIGLGFWYYCLLFKKIKLIAKL